MTKLLLLKQAILIKLVRLLMHTCWLDLQYSILPLRIIWVIDISTTHTYARLALIRTDALQQLTLIHSLPAWNKQGIMNKQILYSTTAFVLVALISQPVSGKWSSNFTDRTRLDLIWPSSCLYPAISGAKSECEKKRDDAERLIRSQERNSNGGLAILVPSCNEDGSYAQLQCHHNSNFCQCWDREGLPQTQPKKNLKKCSCMLDRAKQLKSIPPSRTDLPPMTNCEIDGSYTARQCNREACWCVNPDTGKKIGRENVNKAAVKC